MRRVLMPIIEALSVLYGIFQRWYDSQSEIGRHHWALPLGMMLCHALLLSYDEPC